MRTQEMRVNSAVARRAGLTTNLRRAGAPPLASITPHDLANIVNNDLAVVMAALELVHEEADLPLELQSLLSNAVTRSPKLADHVRELQRLLGEARPQPRQLAVS
jgi:hypothetical protein